MSPNDIDENLKIVELELHMILNADRRLSFIENELNIVEHNIIIQSKLMNQELEDVERLEKNGVASLFNRILGDTEKELEKERQEYLQEVLTYNSLIDELEVLQFEEKILKTKVDKKHDTQQRYDVLLKEKEKSIKLNFPKQANKLKIIDGQIIVNKQLIVETDEAITSGHDVVKHLESMTNNLKYVKQWGLYRLHGKGRYSSYEKKGYIDKAQKLVGMVQVKFNIFEKELQDLYPDFELNLNNYHLKSFVDNFYDGLITDWIIVKNLQVASNNTIAALHKVNRLLAMLDVEKEKIIERIEEKYLERTSFLRNIDLSKQKQ